MGTENKKKQFHRHFATPGLNLYWIIIAYIIIGWFYPVIGLIALICMIGPVLTSIWRGRFWCGNVCPRGNLYDRLLSKYSPHKPIPAFVHTFGFRLFMVFFIFGMFGIQLTFTVPWSEGGLAMWSSIGRVFLDYYRGDNHCRRYAEFHLCATHLVLVLSDGYYLPLGGSKECTTAKGLYEHPRIECLSDEVQELCPRLSDATHPL